MLTRSTLALLMSSALAALLLITSPQQAAAAEAPFSLPALPYADDALEPAIDAETMRIHHGRHHRAYVDNLNAKIAEFPALADASLEQSMARMSSFDMAVRNNGGGHYNHALFWTLMTAPGDGGAPSAALLAHIERDFGSLQEMRQQFSAAGAKQFGSGWAWLIVKDDGALAVTSTANQDNPLMDVVDVRGTPILAVDVWEHAYYLQYQNRRGDYLEKWWSVVNWDTVNALYAAATE